MRTVVFFNKITLRIPRTLTYMSAGCIRGSYQTLKLELRFLILCTGWFGVFNAHRIRSVHWSLGQFTHLRHSERNEQTSRVKGRPPHFEHKSSKMWCPHRKWEEGWTEKLGNTSITTRRYHQQRSFWIEKSVHCWYLDLASRSLIRSQAQTAGFRVLGWKNEEQKFQERKTRVWFQPEEIESAPSSFRRFISTPATRAYSTGGCLLRFRFFAPRSSRYITVKEYVINICWYPIDLHSAVRL